MVFSSLIFLFLFLPLVLVLYYSPLRRFRLLQNILLTAASLAFYAWGEPIFVLVMLALILADWLFGLAIGRLKGRGAKAILILAVSSNLSVLAGYKYWGFVIFNINRIFDAGLDVPDIALPIGISFFTFQAISYVIDVYRGKGKAQRNPLYVCLYISLFPQLVAGPIIRYENIEKQLTGRRETLEGFAGGLMRFVIGLSKKVLLANTLAVVADAAFGMPVLGLSVSMAWLGAITYSLQIYYDFSGYSDMAIGLGAMFGFKFNENFNYPYISSSVSEFWRRWHISLGIWFRDYVYFPMGGSRVCKSRLIFNLFVVWLLTGIWHGASWTFVIWGFYLFALISFEKLCGFPSARNGVWRLIPHIYAMLAVIAGWVIFRSPSATAALGYLKAMAGLGDALLADSLSVLYLKEYALYIAAGALCALPLAGAIKKLNIKVFNDYLYPVGVLMLFLISISYLAKGVYNPFIYFNF